MYFLNQAKITVKVILKLADNPEEQELQLTVPDHTTVNQLKQYLKGNAQIQNDKILLKLEGKPLIDGGKKIKDFKQIQNKAISVVFQQAKGRDSSIGFNFNSLKNRIAGDFTPDAPKWRIVSKGLALEAVCKNANCIAYKRFGDFDIAEQMGECRCPICNTETQPSHKIGFYDTRLFLKGKRQGEKKVEWELIGQGQKYHTFKDGPSQTVRWNFLKIAAKKL